MEGCYYDIIREDMYEEAIKHIAEYNFPDEPICASLGIIMDEESKAVFESVLRKHMSLALVSAQTGEIVGLRALHIGSKDDKFDIKDFKNEANRKMIAFVEYKNSLYSQIWEIYGVDEAIEFFGLSVHKEYRQRGIGLKLMQAVLLFLKSMKLGSVLTKGDCSSNFSKRVYERLDFDCLGEIKFEDYKVDGKQVITNTGKHKSLKIYGKMI